MQLTGPIRLFSAALVVSIAAVTSLVISTVVASRAYLHRGRQEHQEHRTLNVAGSARIRIESDLALWSIRVAGEGKKLEEAFEQLSSSAEKVARFLRQKGFPEEAVELGPIGTTRHFGRDAKGHETREIASYQLTRLFKIQSSEVRRVAKAAGEVTELLSAGVHVESLSPEYLYTRLSDLKIRVQGEATANARARGEQIARESGCRVGAVREARAGILQITPPWSTEVSSSGIHDTSSIEKDVRTSVHLTLMIEPL